jgi:hypothetical protein
VLDKDRNEVPDPAGIQRTVLLSDNALDVFPRHVRVLLGETVHDMTKCPQYFDDAHWESFRAIIPRYKTGLFNPGWLPPLAYPGILKKLFGSSAPSRS